MKFKIKLSVTVVVVTVIFISIIPIKVMAKASPIEFSNITVNDGLSQSNVEYIFQDSKGYIWIGTADGLNKYNGYEFKTYRYNENLPNSILGSHIYVIKEDDEGNIWVGTSNGLSKINVLTDEIKNYYNSESDGNLSHYNVCDILFSKKGNMLVATLDGLNLYDKNTDSFQRVLDKGDYILSGQTVYSIDQDEVGNLWVSTNKGLNKINVEKNEFYEFKFEDEENPSIKNDFIYKVLADKNGYIWVGTYNSGLRKINIHTNEVTIYKNKIDDNKSLPGNCVKSILRDSSGNIWIGTDKGLAKKSKTSDEFQVYKAKAYDRQSLINNNVSYLMEDRAGLIWVGTAGGISIIDPKNKIMHYMNDPLDHKSLSDNMIDGIYEDEQGLVWVATNQHGLNVLNRKTEEVYRMIDGTKPYELSSNRINDITGIGDEIWVATDLGVNVINKKTKAIKKYTKEQGLSNNAVNGIFIDSRGLVWIGSEAGVCILNRETEIIEDITAKLKKNGIDDTIISVIYEDSDGVYWLGGEFDSGLIALNPKSNTIKNYKKEEGNDKSLSFNAVNDINEDSQGNLWIATHYGLNKFNKQTENFTRYNKRDGLANNHIYAVLFDENDNPWISTNRGVSKLNINTNIFRNYNTTDGFQSNEFNRNAHFKNKDGEMFFGGINGLNIFNPSHLDKTDYVPDIIFDEFEVDGEKLSNIDGATFSSKKNLINIKFFLPDYKNNNRTQFYCKLEGADAEWEIVEGNSVKYRELKPGNYTFRVKARHYNGTVSEEESVKFTIEPPFFLSKEAFIIYIVIVLVIIYNNQRKMKKLDCMVAKRTKQLSDEKANSEKLLNKLINLERKKNTHFINLSHDLRTPLNVINSTEQLIYELNKDEKGISKEKLNYYISIMKKNTDRLLALINNLIDVSKIQHGNYPIFFKNIDIVYLVEETALSLAEYVREKGISLIVDPEIEELVIECDEHEIERCIVNLISNAVKFTPEEGQITVGVKNLGPEVMITVKDTGVGIDSKYHDAIFDRFNQVVDPKLDVRRGSGLGLTLVKQIVELHHGEIYVESSLGKGSNFIIILPIKQPKKENS